MMIRHLKYLLWALTLLLAFVQVPVVGSLFTQSWNELNSFSRASFDYSARRLADPYLRTVDEARNILPAGARYEMSPKEYKFIRAITRYSLYPEAQLGDHWGYFIDYTGEMAEQGADWTAKTLSTGVVVYATPGFSFNESDSPADPSLGPQMLWFLVLLVMYLSIGWIVMSALSIPTVDYGVLWFISAAYLVGFIVFNAIMWILLMSGFRLSLFLGGAIYSVIVLLGLVFFHRSMSASLQHFFRRQRPQSRVMKRVSLISVALMLLAAMVVVSVVILAIVSPLVSWDAISFWIIKSKAIFFHQRLDLAFTTYAYYPVLWPLHNAFQFTLVGNILDHMVQWQVAVLILVFVAQMRGVFLMAVASRLWQRIGVALYIVIFLGSSFSYARAETIHMAFMAGLLTSTLLLIRSKGESRYVILTALMALGVGMTKLEGMISVAMVGAALLLVYWRQFAIKKKVKIIIAFMLPLIAELIWVLWLMHGGYFDGVHHLRGGLALYKFFLVILYVPSMLTASPAVGLFISLIIVTIIMTVGTWKRLDKFLILTSAGMLAFMTFAIVGWTEEEILNLFYLGTNRLILHASPFLMLLGIHLWDNKSHSIHLPPKGGNAV